MDVKNHFKADKHALTYVVGPVNGFSSASFMNITTFVGVTSYSGHWDGPGHFAAIL